MTYFAKVENGIVTDVIRVTQDVINSGLWGDPTQWVETSYNTFGGIYYIPNSNPPEPDPDQSKELRANYAGLGYTYDSVNDVFYAPKPEGDGWVIGPPTWEWVNTNPTPTASFTINVGTSNDTITL
jgi:hypothetical protein